MRTPHVAKSLLGGGPYLYVSDEDGNSVAVIDVRAESVVASMAPGRRPRGVRVSPDGSTLIVAVSGSPKGGPGVDESKLPPADHRRDGIALMDLTRRVLRKTLAGGIDPENFDVSLDGKTIYVANEDAATVTVLDVVSGKPVATIPVGREPEGVRISPDSDEVYVTNEVDGTMSVIATDSRVVIATIGVGKRPRSVTFSLDGSKAYVANEEGSSVSVIDMDNRRVKTHDHAHRPERAPMGTALSPDGTTPLRHHRPRRHARRDRHEGRQRARIGRGGQTAMGRERLGGRLAHLHGQRAVERRVGDRRRHDHGRAPHSRREHAVGSRPVEVEAKPAKLGRNILAISAVSFLTDVSGEMIYPLVPLFLTTVLGASAGAVGVIEGLAESTAALLKLASGWISDRVAKRKPLVVFGYALAGFVRPLIGLAQSVAQVAAIRITDRVGKGIRTSPRDALIADSVDPSIRGRAYGFHSASDNAGAVLGPLIGFAALRLDGRAAAHGVPPRRDPGGVRALVVVAGMRDMPRAAAPPARDKGQGALGTRFWAYLAVVLAVHAREFHRCVPAAARRAARRAGGARAAALGDAESREVRIEYAGRRALRPHRAQAAHCGGMGGIRAGVSDVRPCDERLASVGALRGLRDLLRPHRGRGEGAGRRSRAGGTARRRIRLVQSRARTRRASRVDHLRRDLGPRGRAGGVHLRRRDGGRGRHRDRFRRAVAQQQRPPGVS